MFRPTPRPGRRPQGKPAGPRRPRSFRPSPEAVEDRRLLSTLAAVGWTSTAFFFRPITFQHETVYAVGIGNAVYSDQDNTGFVSLGGDVTQISAATDASGKPEVFGLAPNGNVMLDDNGAGWSNLFGGMTAIAAAPGGAVYAVGSNHAVYFNRLDGNGWADQGGDVQAISAATGASGKPEVYGLAPNGEVLADDSGAGWSNLYGGMTAISAAPGGVVYALGDDHAVYLNRLDGKGWADEGGYVTAIGASLDASGTPEVFGIGGDDATYVNDAGKGWVDLGGYVTEIAATAKNAVFARGEFVNQVFVSNGGAGFSYIGSPPVTDPAADIPDSLVDPTVPLFRPGGPSYLDVDQDNGADCWLMASLAEVAARDPQVIQSMFTYDGTTVDDGVTAAVYLVRFYSQSGTAFDIPVTTELPEGGNYYDRVTTALGTQSLWAALAEKAYAEANSLGLVASENEGQDSYAAINWGIPSWGLQAITGEPTSYESVNPPNITAAWDAGELVVLTTGTPSSPYIVANHVYAVVNVNPSSAYPFELFNPWGTDPNGWAPGDEWQTFGLFPATSAFLSQNFYAQVYGYGSANPGDAGTTAGPAGEPGIVEVNNAGMIIGPAGSPSAVVGDGDGDGLSATIDPGRFGPDRSGHAPTRPAVAGPRLPWLVAP